MKRACFHTMGHIRHMVLVLYMYRPWHRVTDVAAFAFQDFILGTQFLLGAQVNFSILPRCEMGSMTTWSAGESASPWITVAQSMSKVMENVCCVTHLKNMGKTKSRMPLYSCDQIHCKELRCKQNKDAIMNYTKADLEMPICAVTKHMQ